MQRRENVASPPAAATGHRRSNGRTPPDRHATPTPTAHVDSRRERLLRLDATRKALLLRQCVSGRARNPLTPRYDLRRRVLETNLARESKCQTAQQPCDLVLTTTLKPAQPTPPRSFRRWGYCDALNRNDATRAASRLEQHGRVHVPQKSPTSTTGSSRASARRPQPPTRSPSTLNPMRYDAKSTPRKLGSPRNFAVASVAAIKKRLRRSWSYREAIAGDTPTNEETEAQAPKRMKTESLGSGVEPSATVEHQHPSAVATTRPLLSKRPCRVRHGKPFAIPTPPIVMPTSSPTPQVTVSQQPQQATRSMISTCATTVSPAMGQCSARFPGTSLAPCESTPTASHRTWVVSSIFQDTQGRVLTPTVAPYRHHLEPLVPLSPSVVSQGTQTSPKRLRRRSSLKRAFERLLSSGKENEANAAKNAKAKVKRRPSLVESLLSRRSGSGSEGQARPSRQSTECVVASKDIGSTPCRKKARRAHSLQLKAPEFDPWG